MLRQQNRQRRIQCQQSAALLTEFIVHFPDVVFRLHAIKLRSHRHHLPSVTEPESFLRQRVQQRLYQRFHRAV